jgi:hypothetical protein
MAAQRPSIFACLTRSVRNASLPSPALGEGGHRGLARRNLSLIHRSWVACCAHQVQNFDLTQTFWCRGLWGLVSTSKSLAQINKSQAVGKAWLKAASNQQVGVQASSTGLMVSQKLAPSPSPLITVAQAKAVKGQLLNALFETKNQAPITFSGHQYDASRAEVSAMANALSGAEQQIIDAVNTALSQIASEATAAAQSAVNNVNSQFDATNAKMNSGTNGIYGYVPGGGINYVAYLAGGGGLTPPQILSHSDASLNGTKAGTGWPQMNHS